MNIERIRQLRDHIAGLNPAKFNMRYWFSTLSGDMKSPAWGSTYGEHVNHNCNTAACLAGHAVALFIPEERADSIPRQDAATLLDLTSSQARYLFEPGIFDGEGSRYDLPAGRTMQSVTNAEAVCVLDYLIATGEVDWRVIQ